MHTGAYNRRSRRIVRLLASVYLTCRSRTHWAAIGPVRPACRKVLQQCFDAKSAAGSTRGSRRRPNARPAARRPTVSGRWIRPRSDWPPASSPVMESSARATISKSRTRAGFGCWPSSTLRSSRPTPSAPASAIRISTGDAQWFSDNIPCMTACPSHTDISRYIALIADGRYADSYELNRENNVFPGCLGRMCARPCEDACRRKEVDAPIGICYLKRVAADFRDETRREVIASAEWHDGRHHRRRCQRFDRRPPTGAQGLHGRPSSSATRFRAA